MEFIDLFAGLGGFHLALSKLGHKCVFACEINEVLKDLYIKNFRIEAQGDIRKIKTAEIPKHDILCAGFPCQPFSKAGGQKGMKDKQNGTLFNEIIKSLKFHKPEYFILENVPFIKNHNNNTTWNYMVEKLEGELKYHITHRIYSPHQFGIPQHRKRIFIIGSKTGLEHFSWPEPNGENNINIKMVLDKKPLNTKKIGKDERHCLTVWQEFLDRIPIDAKLPHPIWSMEFGATYPFEKTTPYKLTSSQLSQYLGSYGVPLKGLSKQNQLKQLPSYARVEQEIFPKWKQNFIRTNREFYNRYKKSLDDVVEKIRNLKIQSWQKFEWNCEGDERIIKNHLIQFRGSGIRVKKIDFAPSLVCAQTQRPIIGWENRYISQKEGARLQSITGLKLPINDNECFRALGNAVNVHIVSLIAKALIN